MLEEEAMVQLGIVALQMELLIQVEVLEGLQLAEEPDIHLYQQQLQ